MLTVAGSSKSKPVPSDDEDEDDVNSDNDDEESSKDQKKKNFDVSTPGMRACIFLNSLYICIAKEIYWVLYSKVLSKTCKNKLNSE